MLEDRQVESYGEIAWEDSFNKGFVLGMVEAMIGIVRRKKAANKIEDLLDDPKDKELLDFCEKYPKMSREKLAKKVIAETEFWQCS